MVLADKLQAAWRRAEELPAPRQYCEQENLRVYLLDDREPEDAFAAMPEKQPPCFSALMRLCGLRQGIYHPGEPAENSSASPLLPPPLSGGIFSLAHFSRGW